jgi:hypothetical protein
MVSKPSESELTHAMGITSYTLPPRESDTYTNTGKEVMRDPMNGETRCFQE